MHLKKIIIITIVLLVLWADFSPIYAQTAEDFINEGNKLLDSGNYVKAIKCYNEAIKINSTLAIVWNKKGIALSYLGKDIEAIKCYDEAIKIDPKYIEAWYNKGNILDKLSDYSTAEQCYNQVIQIAPNSSYGLCITGTTLNFQNKYKEAIKCYDEAIKIDPNFVDAWRKKGILLSNQGKNEEAIKCYDEAIKINSKCIMAWLNKGVTLGNMHKYKEAIKCYDEAIKIDPNFANAWSNKAFDLTELGRNEEATECSNKAEEIKAKNTKALQKLLSDKNNEISKENNNIVKDRSLKITNLKDLSIDINNVAYKGENLLKDGNLYLCLDDLKFFASKCFMTINYKLNEKKLYVSDGSSEYEYKDLFIKNDNGIFISLDGFCKYFKFVYTYNSSANFLSLNRQLTSLTIISNNANNEADTVNTDKVPSSAENSTNTEDNEKNDRDVSLVNYWLERQGNFDYIVGKVKNNSDKQIKSVYIRFNLYDLSNHQVGDTIDSISNLAPNETWEFKIMITVDGVVAVKPSELTHYH